MFVTLKQDYFGQKAGCQIEVVDEVGNALIAKAIAETPNNNALNELMSKSLEGVLTNMTKTLNDTVDASLKAFSANISKSHKNGTAAIFGDGNKGDPNKTFGKFLLAVATKNFKVLEEMGSTFNAWDEGVGKKAAMSTQTGVNGGYVVPTEFYDKLMSLVAEKSIARKRANVITMTARSCQIPTLDVATAPSAGDTAFLGGVVARWTEEAGALNETEPSLKQLELTNYELSGYSKVSNTLLADSAIGLESFLYNLFSNAISWYEDYAFLRGNGVAKPTGYQAWDGLIAATRTTSNLVKLDDIANMYGRLLPGGDESSITWVIHPTVLAQLIKMTGGDQVIFLGNDLNGKPKMKILNYDIVISEKVPALGTANDFCLIDWSKYIIGDRKQVEIAFSEHVAFLNNQSVWRFVSRVAGMPWLRDKITLSDATSTLSPAIGLAA